VGNDSSVIANTECSVALDKLIVPPYSLTKNDEVWAQVIAVNVYGESLISEAGNTGLVKLIPDAPLSLANDEAVTNDSQIKFTWIDGVSDGGDAVIDFTIFYDQATGSGTWVLLAYGNIEYQGDKEGTAD
jgi:hypothetical protein